jgi:hypothetical protein
MFSVNRSVDGSIPMILLESSEKQTRHDVNKQRS